MMFPKDRALYSNLNTSFTDFEGLLADLSGRKLTGYVQVSFPGYEAVLFMANGEPRTAIEQRELARTTGNAAASGLAARVRDKSGVINVYALTPEMLQLLLWTVDAEVLYKDLTSSFTNLDRLVAKLEEDRLTGYVEILFANGKGSAMVFIEGGRTVECVLYADAQSATGPEVYQTVIQHSAAVGASFNVYRVQQEQPAAVAPTPSPLPLAPEQAAESPQLLALWGEILGRVERWSIHCPSRDGSFQRSKRCWSHVPQPIHSSTRSRPSLSTRLAQFVSIARCPAISIAGSGTA